MIPLLLALAALAGVLVGGAFRLLGEVGVADAVWAASTALMLVPLTWSVARTLWRRDVGVDAIALVAMASALVPSKVERCGSSDPRGLRRVCENPVAVASPPKRVLTARRWDRWNNVSSIGAEHHAARRSGKAWPKRHGHTIPSSRARATAAS